jgi:hypothetical protein
MLTCQRDGANRKKEQAIKRLLLPKMQMVDIPCVPKDVLEKIMWKTRGRQDAIENSFEN